MRTHVMVLADDDLEGRGGGYPGEEKAAAYIAERFRAAGLETFVQAFDFIPRAPERLDQLLTSRNVLAVLPGADPRLAGEVVLVGAHHDGQGRTGQADGGRLPLEDLAARADTIWNSADDNASSVAAVLEIARALAGGAARPRRTIVFATFGTEEHALNGSAHLAQHPWPRGARWGAVVNLEKLGRAPDQFLIMAGCSTSAEWLGVLGQANAAAGAAVECLLPELVADTDHYPFGALGVPAIVLGTAHEVDTHQPSDESGRLDYAALARRAGYARSFVELLANRDTLPAFAAGTARGSGLLPVTASPAERERLGLGERGAFKASDVLPGLPAAAAGLRPGDFVISLDGQPFTVETPERRIEETLAERGAVTLAVRRGEKTLTMRLEGNR
ncbi:MAG TPA: M28 family peptidase [Thermoanaerobaculia bacterium]